jgi:exosortase A-associated hydrolase 2
MLDETPQFFLNGGGRRLFSILHRPEQATSKKVAVVICAPLFEEKLWSHRVLVNCARFLASRGVSVLRFDYFGDGESEGRFEDASVSSRVSDIRDAVEFCGQQTGIGTIYLLGLCYGATLAVAAASGSTAISGVVAWAPVMEGKRYLDELLRAHLTAQMVQYRKVIHDREALIARIEAGDSVNVEGYEIRKALYAEMVELDLLSLIRAATRRILVQQISPTDRPDAQYATLNGLQNSSTEFRSVRELKFWTQQ